MNKYLYEDLYQLEDKHWWHISKRRIVRDLLYFNTNYSKRPKILDIGCGAGRNLEELKNLGQTFGIDSSKDAILFCRKRGLKSVVLSKAESTKLPSSEFDVIMLLDVLEHTDDGKTLKEVYRILKPRGVLILTVPAFSWLWSKWDEVLHHKRRYTKKGLSKLLRNYNFNILKISYMFSFLIVPAFLIRLIKSRFSTNNYSSDFKINVSVINTLLLFITRIEKFFILNWSMPFGTSLICVAKKDEK